MALTAGTRLGPYEILGPIGAGGMGEVYKARDTRLERTVAVKVLSAQLAGDTEFRARFEREAKTISQFSHPSICTLHDIGRQDGVDYLVLEYLEGETLARRLERETGGLPIETALKIGVEICDALDRAHRHGITHRDLKPGNVMLTKSGAKLLDFGLAKPARGVQTGGARNLSAPAGAGISDRLTELSPGPMTSQGTILGTFQYMAPEQIEGQEADARSDIWALGCLLYETITGRRVFAGKTQASLLGAILKVQPPPISSVVATVPPALDHIVTTCLAKDPDERWQSAGDIGRELKWLTAGRSDVAPRGDSASRTRERAIWAAAVVGLAILAGALIWTRPPAAVSTGNPPARFVLPLGAEAALVNTGLPNVAVSPDGRHVAYRGAAQLFIRAVDEAQSRAIAGTDGAAYPFFSPDSQSLGFVVGPTIKRVALSGGAPVTVAPGGGTAAGVPFRGVAWGDDGFIYYTPTVSAGLWRIQASGGTPEQLTTPEFAQGEKTHRWPFVLPGSRALLFIVGTSRITTFDDARIEALTLATKQRHRLIEGGTFPQFVPTGHLLYSRDGSLLAVRFDPDKLEVTGSPVTVLSGATRDALFGLANHGFSANGTLAYISGGTTSVIRTLAAVDRTGSTKPLPPQPALYSSGRLSPDGSRFAVFFLGATSQISVVDLVGGQASRLTFEWDNESPIWTPKGERVTFTSNRGGGPRNLYWQTPDGGSDAERLTKSEREQVSYAWSPDGKMLVYGETDPATLQDIWVLSLDDKKARPLVNTPGVDINARLSPDGRWIAYQSNQSGRPEVYVQAFPTGGRRWQVSTDGGTAPAWQRNGRELIYRRGSAVMAVPVTMTSDFRHGSPVRLFESPQLLADVLPDGRFLMMVGEVSAPVSELNVVVNWFDDLRRKVTGK
jgi:serine/threonine-protein kinase